MSFEQLRFGPFELLPSRRQLLKDGQPVALGSRAIEILILLAERAGELVTHREITERVWPDTFVEDANRRVHINLLRKALGERAADPRFIASEPGRGYRFIAPVMRVAKEATPKPPGPTLPAALGRVIGREATARLVIDRLQQRRFVTLVGTGGIGKTTAALAITRQIADRYEDAPAFLDLVPLQDGQRVAVTLATIVKVTVRADAVIPDLIRFLAHKRMLLVFDNCEHVIDDAAQLAEAILKACPGIHVLATSREPLRADGEWVHRLAALDLPAADEPDLTAARAMEFSAVELFVERAMAGADGFGLSDADTGEVAALCRSLDGIPLAIELAAARVAGLSVREIARGLDRPLDLLRGGRRTAQPRHRTLGAVLDWSHDLLSPTEQATLRRLSVFPANFTFEAAAAIVADDAPSPWDMSDRLGDLTAKSMLSVQRSGDGIAYRLLETTRAYAAHKLRLAGEEQATWCRHADYFREQLERLAATGGGTGEAELGAASLTMDDVRSALDRMLRQERDVPRGLALIGAVMHFWLRLSRLHEHHDYLELAALHLRAGHHLPPEVEFRLQMGRGMTLFVRNNDVPAAETALERAWSLARTSGDDRGALKTLGALFAIEAAHGNYGAEARYAEAYGELAMAMADTAAINVHKRMHSRSLHDLGEQDEALKLAEVQLAQFAGQNKRPQLGANEADSQCIAIATWARIMWMRGFPDQALAEAERGFARALEIESTQTACWVLVFNMCPISLWRGDLAATRRHAADLLDRSHKTFERWYDPWCGLYQNVIASIESGRAPATPLATVPVQADLIGTFAPILVDAATAARAMADEHTWCAAEILRARAEQLMDLADLGAAQSLLARSEAIARRQGALSWGLRTATSLVRLRALQGQPAEGLAQLRVVYDQFTEGFETADLAAARGLLD